MRSPVYLNIELPDCSSDLQAMHAFQQVLLHLNVCPEKQQLAALRWMEEVIKREAGRLSEEPQF